MEQETTNYRIQVFYYTFRLLFFFGLGFLLIYYSLKFIETANLGSKLFLSFGVSILFVVITSWGLIGLTQSKK
jgi:hypothetical protein